MDFSLLEDHWVKIKESRKIEKYLGLSRELEKAVEHEGDSNINSGWCNWNGPQMLSDEPGGTGNERKDQCHPDHFNVKRTEDTCCH